MSLDHPVAGLNRHALIWAADNRKRTHMSNTTKPIRFVSASSSSAGEELLDKLLVLRPIREEAMETKLGPGVATICQVLVIADDGSADDQGERPIFWSVVRQQLARATDDTPWIAGRLVQPGQAYRLESLTPADSDRVSTALESLAA